MAELENKDEVDKGIIFYSEVFVSHRQQPSDSYVFGVSHRLS